MTSGIVPREEPGLTGAGTAFAAMASVYFFSYFQRSAVPGTIFNELQADTGLGAAGVTALGALFTWIYGGMQIVVGLLVDAWGGRRMLLLGGLAMTAGSLFFPLAPTVPTLFAARALTGLGTSFIYLSILKELYKIFGSEHFSALLGTMLAIGYCGGMAATLPFERAVAAIGWRPALLAVALAMVAALAATASTLRPAVGVQRLRMAPSPGLLPGLFANRRCWPLFGSSLLGFPIYFVILTVLGKKYLQDFAGLSSAAAAAFMLAMTAASALTAASGGILPRLFGNRQKPAMLLGATLFVVSMAMLLGGTLHRSPEWVYLAGYILLAVALIGGPSAFSTMKDLGGTDSMAAGISILNALSYVGCGFVGQIGGMILDRYPVDGPVSTSTITYPQGAYVGLFYFLSALALLNFVLTLAVPETGAVRARNRQDERPRHRSSRYES